jgi:hypothetical protein
MDITTWYKGNEKPVPHKNAICVFESDSSEWGGTHPGVWRVCGWGKREAGWVQGWKNETEAENDGAGPLAPIQRHLSDYGHSLQSLS